MAVLLQPSEVPLAVRALTAGELVAFPTETVYGLGADAASPEAVAKIFAAKGRPAGHPLIVHMADGADLGRFTPDVSAVARKLAEAFWPGPLTLVVPRGEAVAAETVGGMATVGMRVPDHPVALDLLEQFGAGVAAPSANRFGSVSPTTAQHVLDDLGSTVDFVLDGGPSRVGVESTIVDVTGAQPILLRPGGISVVELEAVLGPVIDGTSGPSRAPGMLASHYAPRAEVRLSDVGRLSSDVVAAGADGLRVGVVAPFPLHDVAGCEEVAAWELPADARGYAEALYATLRSADQRAIDRLLVVPPRSGDLLEAVIDRLTKAAAPRPAR